MREMVHERVSVISVFSREKGTVMPVKLRWQAKEYRMIKLGYYHRVPNGRFVNHIFHVTDGTTDFRLRFESETLHWILEEVTDGNAS
ncbi:MAG TPA: hypothetical protein PKG71_03670 [Candidatus Woesebacteria bacterium]|jgi:hypothetical protein|nr:hypothetical protein [Candidatus Woesebacteria bacterium]HNS95040.1 hypothetical protein [Candidatus Woesebacteria bacterium]